MIRKAAREDALKISRVRVQGWQSTYKGLIDQKFLDGMSEKRLAEKWEKDFDDERACTWVAEIDNEIIGFAIAGESRESDFPHHPYEIMAIYLLKPHQNQGIGQMLVSKIIEQLALTGDGGIYVWAFDENPYCAFYQKLGGTPMSHQVLEIEGKGYNETAYGWESLRDIRL
ncbi:N-acetyltransferase family protein [Jeotgalibacillus proteolyticus]|uniref:GNAT family N-acetyltransferase n=1 Tax=Jeotgalibacillus proteolyticus TaxID=2082395 RepID=UPI003CF51BF5